MLHVADTAWPNWDTTSDGCRLRMGGSGPVARRGGVILIQQFKHNYTETGLVNTGLCNFSNKAILRVKPYSPSPSPSLR